MQTNDQWNDKWTVENIVALRQQVGELDMKVKILGVAAQRDEDRIRRLESYVMELDAKIGSANWKDRR